MFMRLLHAATNRQNSRFLARAQQNGGSTISWLLVSLSRRPQCAPDNDQRGNPWRLIPLLVAVPDMMHGWTLNTLLLLLLLLPLPQVTPLPLLPHETNIFILFLLCLSGESGQGCRRGEEKAKGAIRGRRRPAPSAAEHEGGLQGREAGGKRCRPCKSTLRSRVGSFVCLFCCVVGHAGYCG